MRDARRGRSALLLTVPLLLAGCLGQGGEPGPDAPGGPDGDVFDSDDPFAMTFSAPLLIDDMRAGGEPVIAVTHNDVIIVSAHPGYTHIHPGDEATDPPEEAVVPTSGQSYLWRSLDGGATWTTIGLPGAPMGLGPRGVGQGISDPDLTITASNRVYLTDLEALAAASVSWSDDDGATWLLGNNVASGGAVDRQWLASHGDTVFFTANYFTDHRLLRSTDGVVWERMGDTLCSGDLVAAPDGTLYAGCGAGVSVSEDGGANFEVRRATEEQAGGGMREPAVDSAGNVWIVYASNGSLVLAGSPDKGVSWPWAHNLTQALWEAHSPGEDAQPTFRWPWVSAGSAGRVAVTAFARPASQAEADDQRWSVVTAAVFGADTSQPRIAGHMLREGHHVGPICGGGTFCQVGSLQGDDSQDRRLGDFFETTLDNQGFLHVVFSNTSVKPNDAVSHPEYVRQVGGPSFLVDGDDFRPLQG